MADACSGRPAPHATPSTWQTDGLLSADGPIGFVVENPAVGGPDILISTDAAWGRLRLRLKNNTGGPVALGPASTLKLYLWPLLTSDQVGAVTVPGPGWTGGPVTDAHGRHLELHPAAQGPGWPAGGTIEIALDNVLASGAATTGYVRFEYGGFGGVADGGQRVKVFVQAPPTWPHEWPLGVDFGVRPDYGDTADTVYVTPWTIAAGSTGIENHFLLRLHNSGKDAIPLPPGATPRFVISFLSGDADACLCSDDQLGLVEVEPVQTDPGHHWTIDKSSETGAPIWTVTPDEGNANLFDAGGILTLRFRGLVTRLAAGPASPVFVQHAGLPGCNDGYTAPLLTKAAPVPYVRSFKATSGGTEVASGGTVDYGPLALAWEVFAAQHCFLQENGTPDATRFDPADAATVQATRQAVSYELRAGIGDHEESAAALQFVVAPPAAAIDAGPTAAPAGYPVTLTWTCRNGDHCTLYAADQEIASGLGLTGSKTVTIDHDTEFAIVCHGAGDRKASTTVAFMPIAISVEVLYAAWTVLSAGSDGPGINMFAFEVQLSWDASAVHPTTSAVSHPLLGVIVTSTDAVGSFTVGNEGPDPTFGYGSARIEDAPFTIETSGPYGTVSASANATVSHVSWGGPGD